MTLCNVIDLMTQGVIILNKFEKIVQINPSACKMLNIDCKEAIQVGIQDLKLKRINYENYREPMEFTSVTQLLGSEQIIKNVTLKKIFENNSNRMFKADFIKINSEDDGGYLIYIILENITELNKILKELKNKNLLFSTLMTQIPDTIYFKDLKSRFILINNAQAKLLGVNSPEDAVGKTDFDFFPHAEQAFKDEQEIIQTQVPIVDKVESIKKADGVYTWVSTTKVPLIDDSNKVRGTFGITRFVEDRIRNEEKIKQSEAQLRAILENSFDGMCLFDKSGKIILVNKAFCNMVKIPGEDLAGHNFITILSPSVRSEYFFDGQMCVDKFVFDTVVEEELVLWDSRKIWVENAKTFIVTEDKGILIISIFRDITERKKMEAALKAEKEELSITLRNIGDGVIKADANDCITIVNKAAEEILGLDESRIIGKSIFEVVELLNDSGSTEKSSNEMNLDYVKKFYSSSDFVFISSKQAKDKIITLSTAEILGENNKVCGFVYVLKDITEQLKVETQLNLSQKMESIGRLAAGIAHEINTPMQYISDNTAFLKDAFTKLNTYLNYVDDEVQISGNGTAAKLGVKQNELDIPFLNEEIPAALEQSQIGLQRVSNIVLAMKNFAHPGSREKIFSDINKGIEITATISRNEWKYTSELELKLDQSVPPVYCVLDEINQVILNMIINSVHAIQDVIEKDPGKKGKIIIQTWHSGQQAFIKITDNGKGISAANINRIFDPFFTTKEVGKGTGQGLSIAHDIIVNKHKGKISVESFPGECTTFTIKLPVSDEERL